MHRYQPNASKSLLTQKAVMACILGAAKSEHQPLRMTMLAQSQQGKKLDQKLWEDSKRVDQHMHEAV